MTTWKNTKTEKLFTAFSLIDDKKEAANFCRDLMTEDELDELASRFEVAIALSKGDPQRKVSKETGVSIATVTRVNQWLKRGMGGYVSIINKFHHHKSNSRES